MSTSAVVVLINNSFHQDDGGGVGYNDFIRMTGRADSGFYVHADGFPDTLGAALLQLRWDGVFELSSMVGFGDPTYWSGIYPAGTNVTGDGREEIINGVVCVRGIHDTEQMADYYTDYELDITTGEFFLSDRFGSDFVYVVGVAGISCISSTGEQSFAEWGDTSYSRIASKPARTAAIPGLDWKYRAGDEWGGSDWIGFVSDGSYILHAYESGEWELEDSRQNIVAYDQASDIEAAKVAVEGAYAAEVGGIQQTLARRHLAQDDETNWETDEIDRFIANDEILYDATEGVTDPREMEGIVQDFFGGNLGYPEQDPGVDWEVVDWDEVVMVRNSSRRQAAEPAGPMTEVEDKTCEYCDDPWHGMKPCPVQGCQCAHVEGLGTSFARRATRYPDIEVELVGQDGNAFAILGAVMKALRRAGVPQEEIDEFMDDAQSGDYDHLLQTCMEWVEVY